MPDHAQQQCTLQAPFGWLVLVLERGSVAAVDIAGRRPKLPLCDRVPGARTIGREIERYLLDPGYQPAAPLLWTGTAFQRRVWRFLRRIPSGTVYTYGQVARELKTAPRAIGQACASNPLPVLVPCHRVVAGDGIGGYSAGPGQGGLPIKRWLLRHEGVL